MDIDGLVTTDRKNLDEWLAPFAQDRETLDLMGAIEAMQPDALIGATGVPGTFTAEAVYELAFDEGLSHAEREQDVGQIIAEHMYDPRY